MSHESTSPEDEHGSRNQSTSVTPPSSRGGATTIPFDTRIPCSTFNSGARSTTSGAASAIPDDTANKLRETQAAIASRASLNTRVTEIAGCISEAKTEAEVTALLRLGTEALGIDSAAFINFVRSDSGIASCRFMLAGDPRWCQRYVDAGFLELDPWLAYAIGHSEPVIANRVAAFEATHRQVISWMAEYGFASAAVVPIHPGRSHPRISALYLGSATPGYFTDGNIGVWRLGARLLAAELHDWWHARVRQEAISNARLMPSELALLRHEYRGHSSKKIAAEMGVSKSSINSRFQRLSAKLGVSGRRAAVRFALEHGLFPQEGFLRPWPSDRSSNPEAPRSRKSRTSG